MTVTVTDNVGPTRSDTAAITVDITDVNEFAPVADDATFGVPEDASNGTAIGTVAVNDSDATKAFRFAITGGNADGALSIDPSTGEIAVKSSDRLDHETTPEYTLAVEVTDQLAPSMSDTATIRINVGDVNEAPVAAATIPGQQAEENEPFDYAFGADTFDDVDDGDTFAFAATQTDGSALPEWLSFDGPARTFSGVPNLLDRGVIDVKVTATDSGGLTAETTFTISVAADATPWQNPIDPVDVNEVQGATALDVLLVINYINEHGVGPLPEPSSPSDVEGSYVDCNGDNIASAQDVLAVINYINTQPTSGGGEGEVGGTASPVAHARTDLVRPSATQLANTVSQSLTYAYSGATFQQEHDDRTPTSWGTLWRHDAKPSPQDRANDRYAEWQSDSDDWEDTLAALSRDVARSSPDEYAVDEVLSDIADELEDNGGQFFQG